MPVLDKNCNEFPVVVKSKNGHGGTEVFMVENHRELVEKLDVLKDNYVIQKMMRVCIYFGTFLKWS